ncbi:MAG: methylenetetrahydrofolate reductase [NAD(P)H], partial [Lachnospiraceae bacterium]|nr:methylenetetrahydrofolate reductase [NAD(P)H] [Lachnospiraceae bacterium]
MKIKEMLKREEPHISFEVFPPKTDKGFDSVINTVDELSQMQPSYISVTYGAGGGTSKNTVNIASHIQNKLGVTALAHLTCVSSTKDQVRAVISELKEAGIENILALRGDIPKDSSFPVPNQYKHAYELVNEIKNSGDFCVGAACYPEVHPDTFHKADDIKYLKEKVDCGVDFLTTQLFFDNNVFYNYLYRLREVGISIPVIPGIMPVTNGKQIARTCEMSSATLPPRFKAIADKFGDNPEAMEQAGIAYATEQIVDLIAN